MGESTGGFEMKKNMLLTMETFMVVSKEHLGGHVFGELGNNQANVVSGPHEPPSQCGGHSEPWLTSPEKSPSV